MYGFHGARVQRIAHKAGVNKQLIYHHFGSKRQIHGHCLRLAAQQISPATERKRRSVAPPDEELRRVLRVVAQQVRAHPNLVRTALLAALDQRQDGTEDLSRATLALSQRIAAEVSRGQGLGFFRDDADPEDCGRNAAVLLLGWVALDGVLASDTKVSSADPAWVDSVIALLGRSLTW